MKMKRLLLPLAVLMVSVGFTSCVDQDDTSDAPEKRETRQAPYKFLNGFKDHVEYQLEDGITGSDWMSKLDNDEKVCKLSIPGTHDALTGMGFYHDVIQYVFNQTAISQVSTLNDQLQNGVRFFDIRPVVSTDTISHKKVLRCTHGLSELQVTFEESLDMLRSFLKKHPGEFVIVKIQHDNGMENQVDWPKMMKKFLKDYDEEHSGLFATWTPNITVGELRGKILFINRKTFDGMYGAHCEWPDEDPDIDEDFYPEEEMSRILVQANAQNDSTTLTTVYVQDYYKTTNSLRQVRKLEAVTNMLREARLCTAQPEDNTWIINHCSAYTEVSPRGYVTNASVIHPAVIQSLLANPKQRVGIVAMDFACFDNVDVVINGYTPYTSDYIYGMKPMSQSMTNLLIMSNF